MILKANFSLIVLGIILMFVMNACKENGYPRPRGFHRLILPEPTYQKFDESGFPFTFDYPTYGQITLMKKDSLRFNIHFPKMNADWFITGRFFDDKKVNYDFAAEDYRKLVYKHTQKGTVNEIRIHEPNLTGTFYELNGDVATTAAFFVSDTLKYAINGSLYFNTAVKNDSLLPIIEHLKKDMKHLIKTIQWKHP